MLQAVKPRVLSRPNFTKPYKSQYFSNRLRQQRLWNVFKLPDPDFHLQARLAIELAVGQAFGVDQVELSAGKRGERRIAFARQVAMYLAHVVCGLTMTDVGRMFGRDRTTVAHACHKVEQRRDHLQFDRALDLLAWAVPVMVQRPFAYRGTH